MSGFQLFAKWILYGFVLYWLSSTIGGMEICDVPSSPLVLYHVCFTINT